MRLNTEASAARTLLAAAAGVLFGLLAVLNAAVPTVAEGPLPPLEERVDNVLASEGFEGVFPGQTWSVSDTDLSFGADQWSTTTYRSDVGARSAWAAAAGDRTESALAFLDTFETGGLVWSAEDSDPNYGDDYWGLTDAKAYSGTYSFWNGQNGYNAEYGDYDTNVAFGLYDSYMNTTLTRPVDLTGYVSATFEFWYWMDIEAGYDYFSVVYFDNGWTATHTKDGSSGGWVRDTVTIPTSATIIGFMFTSDSTVIYPGVFVDSPSVYGQKRVLNSVSHLYDDGMDAMMTRTVDFDQYEWAHVDYRYWLDVQQGNDYLEVVYFENGWNSALRHDTSSGGWLSGSAEVPVTATRVGFRFVSDNATRGEGAYVDEVRIVGSVGRLACSASVAPESGVESVTPFLFVPTVTGGLRPFTWDWQFGDGIDSTAGSPSHPFAMVGTFTPTVTVRDQLGQFCTAASPPVTVDHDISVISMTPSYAEVTEGGSLTFAAFDVRGHTLGFDLSVAPTSCGSVTMEGTGVLFESNSGAGGLTCTLSASIGGSVGSSTVVVQHDTSSPSISPALATVVESESLTLSAFDTFDHPLGLSWSASCGRLDPPTGPVTTFTATTSGGKTCTVTGVLGLVSAVAAIEVVHDLSELSITPQQAALIEGSQVGFSIVDRYDHSIDATWSVGPTDCGSLSPTEGPSTTFTVALNAGGKTCTVRGSSGGGDKTAAVAVSHAWSSGSIEPANGVLEEGATLQYTARDANGHAVAVPWTVSPGACGEVSPLDAATTTFTANPNAGGMTCTVTASAGSLVMRATATVEHTVPATIAIELGSPEAGRSAVASALVRDAGGHALDASSVAWTTTCGGVSPAVGASATVLADADAAGSNCQVTASDGLATRTVEVRVLYARPYAVKITPGTATAGTGSTQTMEVTVTDAAGNAIDPSGVAWSTTCGTVTGSGARITYTAPSSGESCSVSASLDFDGAESSGAVSIALQSSAPSPAVLGGVGAAIAAAAVGALLVMRSRASKRAEKGAEPSEATDK